MKPAMFTALLSRLAGICVAACLTLASLPAHAVIGALDNVPAATLLMPYFEVDLNTTPTGDQQGVRTSLRITNTSASAMLTHVTLWTDQGVPTYGFNVYLTGLDSTDIDMRLLFKGILPKTASDGQDPMDNISPQGSWSQDINFASCTGILPYAGLLDAATVTGLRNAHTGQASTLTGGLCGGRNHGDNIARGYVTVDSMVACTTLNPDNAGYYPLIDTRNIMVGTVTWTDPANNFAAADPAIHIEASFTDPIANTPGEATPTFYGRLNGWTATDRREPLGSVWQARFIDGGIFSGGTTAMVWRDPGAPVAPFNCAAPPAPLSHYEATFVDEQENVASMAANSFPLATQALDVGADLAAPYVFGFMHLNLNTAADVPRQAVVSVRHSSAGRFSGSVPGVKLFRTGQECLPATTPVENPGCNSYYAPTITGPVGP